eukprot:Opistho-2@23418
MNILQQLKSSEAGTLQPGSRAQSASNLGPARTQSARTTTGQSGLFATGRIQHKYAFGENGSELFSVRFSPDSLFVAIGCGNGSVKVFNTQTGKLTFILDDKDEQMRLPATCLRWRPVMDGETKNHLLVSYATGKYRQWHATSNKCVSTITEDMNQGLSIDYRLDGRMFATGGIDLKVRVYNEQTKQVITEMYGGTGEISAGHSNRIFSLKFHPEEPETIVTSGWDGSVQIWDMRMGRSVRKVFGVNLCGDAMDINGTTILTGSWRKENALQMWDFRSGNHLVDIPWNKEPSEEPCLIYCAQFSKRDNGALIAAAGCKNNTLRLLDRKGQTYGSVRGFEKGLYSLDFSPDGTMLAVVGGDQILYVGDISPKVSAP